MKVMRDVYLSVNCKTLGDTICFTPTLRKVFYIYNKKINVVVPEESKRIFINNPYIQDHMNDDYKNDKQCHLRTILKSDNTRQLSIPVITVSNKKYIGKYYKKRECFK
jgi:ADP-heptose:LPS heptosyltransferase